MHKLSDLKRGDKLITQNPETYEYALHKVSGTTGSNAVILDGGSYLLQQSNAGDSLYAMRRIATTYRAGNDPQSELRRRQRTVSTPWLCYRRVSCRTHTLRARTAP